jgi:hypothetical protein
MKGVTGRNGVERDSPRPLGSQFRFALRLNTAAPALATTPHIGSFQKLAWWKRESSSACGGAIVLPLSSKKPSVRVTAGLGRNGQFDWRPSIADSFGENTRRAVRAETDNFESPHSDGGVRIYVFIS